MGPRPATHCWYCKSPFDFSRFSGEAPPKATPKGGRSRDNSRERGSNNVNGIPKEQLTAKYNTLLEKGWGEEDAAKFVSELSGSKFSIPQKASLSTELMSRSISLKQLEGEINGIKSRIQAQQQRYNKLFEELNTS